MCWPTNPDTPRVWPHWGVVLVLFCFLPCCAGETQPRLPRLLILYEVGTTYPGILLIDQGIRDAIGTSPNNLETYREYMDTILFPDPADQRRFRDFYIRKYWNRKPDVIITVGPSPLKFMMETHAKAFPGVPIFFCIPNWSPGTPALSSGFSGVGNDIATTETIGAALRLQPSTQNIVVVNGTSNIDRSYGAVVREQLRSYEREYHISYLTNLAMPDLVERLKHLPTRTIVLYASFSQDATGTKFTSAGASAIVTAAANVPVFSLSDLDFGSGQVGGKLASLREQGRTVARLAQRFLKGEKLQAIPVVKSPTFYKFDWRALKRWGFKESDLPPGSIVVNRPFNVWNFYKWYIAGGISLVLLQALLILSLLWLQARRKRAEGELLESEGRFRLVANTAPVMIWMSGTDKLFAYFNQPWLEFTGRTFEEELGSGWPQGVHSDDLQRYWESYSNSFDRRASFQIEYRLRRHDGEYRWMFDQGVPRFNADGSFAGYIGSSIDVTERKNAEEALSSIGRKLIEAHEEERTWIARELHDDFNQRITLLAVNLTGLKKTLSFLNGQLSLVLDEVIEQVKELGTDIQALAHRLHSSKLEYLGLAAACAGFCRELSERHKIEIDFDSENVPKKLPQELSLCLFRILQEALRNAVKHSGVQRFQVSLIAGSNAIQLTIRDSGVGFDPGEAMKGAGLGLTSMKERLKLVDGELLIESRSQHGTIIHATIPLAAKAMAAKAGI